MTHRTAETYTAQIYIAGDVATARQLCRHFCSVGLCVTIEPVDFCYTGGLESGVRIGLINYPKFPRSPAEIKTTAIALANELRSGLAQHSWSIVMPDETIFDTVREDFPSPSTRRAEG